MNDVYIESIIPKGPILNKTYNYFVDEQEYHIYHNNYHNLNDILKIFTKPNVKELSYKNQCQMLK